MKKVLLSHIIATVGLAVFVALGLGSTTYEPPPPPPPPPPWASVSTHCCFTVGIRVDGTLWAWGGNGHGQLGDGTRTSRTTPVRIGAAANWAYVSAGGGPGSDHTVAIRTDGSLWAWGWNDRGQLGDGTRTSRNAPAQIGAMTNWASVSASFVHTMAIRTDGTLWAWGCNEHGQLGDGTTTLRTSPVRIGTDTNWASVSAGSGSEHTMAIRTDGSLWAWGTNDIGRTGLGMDTGNTLFPTQIGSEKNWAFVSAGYRHNAAIRTDGTLWAWGRNARGELGDDTTTARVTPVQIGTASGWASVSVGGQQGAGAEMAGHTLATRTDGSLWAWGDNGRGQLGDGTTTSRNSPVRIVR